MVVIAVVITKLFGRLVLFASVGLWPVPRSQLGPVRPWLSKVLRVVRWHNRRR